MSKRREAFIERLQFKIVETYHTTVAQHTLVRVGSNGSGIQWKVELSSACQRFLQKPTAAQQG